MATLRYSAAFALCFALVGYLVGIGIALLFPPDFALQIIPLVTILVPAMALISDFLLRWRFIGGPKPIKHRFSRLLIHSALTSMVSLACLAGLIVLGFATPAEALVFGGAIVIIACAIFAKLVLKSR